MEAETVWARVLARVQVKGPGSANEAPPTEVVAAAAAHWQPMPARAQVTAWVSAQVRATVTSQIALLGVGTSG